MKIAVLSGKGGTGKTTVSTNLFYVSTNFVLFDADVEEPNSHIFIKSEKENRYETKTYYPVVNKNCDLCGKCGKFCRFNAIIPSKNTVIVFKESCHDCGGCKIVCPNNAIDYQDRVIGNVLERKLNNDKNFYYGKLNVGELSGVKIIKDLNGIRDKYENTITDCPPGTSCSTVESLDGIEYAVLVSEPTPFGVSDMKMVVELLRTLKIKFDVVVNKAGLGDNEIYEYCKNENINIIAEIPFEKEIASIYSKGEILAEKNTRYYDMFKNILSRINQKESDEK